jgi:hypothetical protein
MTDSKQLPTLGAVREQRHDFTPAQLATMQPVISQMQEAQRFLARFIRYVELEAKLPKGINGYSLEFDDDGTPYMRGQVPTAAKE